MRQDLTRGLVSRTEFCDQLGIDQRTAYNWHQRNYGPPRRRFGGRIYYAQADIDAFIRELTGSELASVVA